MTIEKSFICKNNAFYYLIDYKQFLPLDLSGRMSRALRLLLVTLPLLHIIP